ncbi:MAG: hypothetical protein HYS53_00440 [Candidatus Aenigmarchaeota archaeon]|nr:hypothetical protein [Candidatus Aenigmarchaeota archaeon]
MTLAIVSVFSASSLGSKVGITPTITEMGVCTASFTNQLVRITNLGAVTDTYKLNSDSGMIVFAGCTVGTVSNNEVVLAPGETAFCSVFVNPLNNTAAQKYPVTLNADSESSADSASAKISVDVLRCNAVSITTQETVQACAREKFSEPLIIKNTGRAKETFNISASIAGKFDRPEIVLEPGQSSVINFESALEKVSNNTVKFVAKSKDSFASAEAFLDVGVRECFKFGASLAAPAPMCSRRPAAFELSIQNTGSRADVFQINASEVEPGQKQITLNASQNATIRIPYLPEVDGKFRLNVSVKSLATDSVKTLSTEAEARECATASLSPRVPAGSICTGEKFTYAIDIKNTGAFAEFYSLNASLGTLSADRVMVESGDVKTVYLTANTTGLLENRTHEITLTASAGSMKNSTKLSLNVVVCHNAVMKLLPQSLTVCIPERATFKVEINNTGRRPETFAIFAAGNKIADNFLVAENTSNSREFDVDYSNETGVYRVDADAVSQALIMKSAAALVVRDFDACYGASLASRDASKTIKPSDRTLQELQLRNTGIMTLNYILQLVGPQWMAVGISNITLEPNETGKVYLYIAPPFGTKFGNYSTRIIVISEKGVSSGVDFVTNVAEPTTTLRPANATTTTVPTEGGERRTVVIGIILAIGAILVLRYIFTSK